jgi:dihydroorotase
LDDSGNVRTAVRRAVERGVLLDVGHGQGSFAFSVTRRALAQAFEPATISSDLHHYNIHGPVFDLATTVSKFLALGFPIERAVEKVTAIPARSLRFQERLGTLQEGACADIAVFVLEEGAFPLQDSDGETVVAPRRLVPELVIRAGTVADRCGRLLDGETAAPDNGAGVCR